jgi:hypothetical protein
MRGGVMAKSGKKVIPAAPGFYAIVEDFDPYIQKDGEEVTGSDIELHPIIAWWVNDSEDQVTYWGSPDIEPLTPIQEFNSRGIRRFMDILYPNGTIVDGNYKICKSLDDYRKGFADRYRRKCFLDSHDKWQREFDALPKDEQERIMEAARERNDAKRAEAELTKESM